MPDTNDSYAAARRCYEHGRIDVYDESHDFGMFHADEYVTDGHQLASGFPQVWDAFLDRLPPEA